MKALSEYLAPSRQVVVFSEFMEAIEDCYIHLRENGDMINFRTTETWLREYQVVQQITFCLVEENLFSVFLTRHKPAHSTAETSLTAETIVTETRGVMLSRQRTTKELVSMYRKSPKFSDTQNVCYNQPKIQTKRFFHRKFLLKCADRMAKQCRP